MARMKDGSRLPWEVVFSTGAHPHLWRLEVPGGWLVAVYSELGARNLTFLPDPKHEWDHHWCLDTTAPAK